jgi:hypothetical protein
MRTVRSAECTVHGAGAGCEVRRAKCEVRRAPCEVRRAPREVRRAPREVRRAPCAVPVASGFSRTTVRRALRPASLPVVLLLVAIVTLTTSVSDASAQVRPGRGGRGVDAGPLADAGVSPAEIQRLFDAYVVMQAQPELGLSDEQYPRFLTRVRTLQEVRRRAEMERNRILQELRRLTNGPNADENLIRARVRALDELEVRAVTDIRTALEAVDQILDVRQQARFRVFEEQMERRKVELLLRARQANRPRNQPPLE